MTTRAEAAKKTAQNRKGKGQQEKEEAESDGRKDEGDPRNLGG